MPYPRDHAAQTRSRILRSAQELFQRRGFDNVTVRQVMARAGLTHGSFYRYFQAKGVLYAEVVRLAFDFDSANGPGVVQGYLSTRHLENLGRQCPLIALPSDVARSDEAVKEAFEGVFRAMTRCFERDLAGSARRDRALAIAGMCVGAMTVSRALADPQIAAALRQATIRCALWLGGWKRDAGTGDEPTVRSAPMRRARVRQRPTRKRPRDAT